MTDIYDRRAALYRRGTLNSDEKKEEGSSIVTLRLASVSEESIADGPGVRLVVFAQGCPHRCRGCHNPSTHSFTAGRDISIDKIIGIYQGYAGYRGITLSGGEPFCQSGPMSELAEEIRNLGGDVVAYTGYRIEDLKVMARKDKGIERLLRACDLVIDGKYEEEKRCLEIPFAGSLNQRYVSLSVKGNELLEMIPGRTKELKRVRFISREN